MSDIKKALREALLKKPKRQYDYGCVMIGLNAPEKDWNKIQEMIDEEDIYTGDKDDNGGFGRELDPHITILFGVHADVPDSDVEVLIDKIENPEIVLDKISSFKNELFDVLKFDVKSDDLHKLNTMFKKLPHTSSFPDYHPHVTIAYIKKGKVEKYVNLMKDIKPIDASSSEVLYSKSDGSKKKYPIK